MSIGLFYTKLWPVSRQTSGAYHFEERKNTLLLRRRELDEKVAVYTQQDRSFADILTLILGLCKTASFLLNAGMPEEKRSLVETMSSDRLGSGKNAVFTLAEPFLTVSSYAKNADGGANRARLEPDRKRACRMAGIWEGG